MLTKFCNKQGCKNLCHITDRYCLEHTYLIAEQEAERQARYDAGVRHGRDAQYTAFYHSPEWEAMRDYVIKIHSGLDVFAYYSHQELIPATIVHHIVELKESWDKRLVIGNLIPVSDESHREIGQRYKRDKRKAQAELFEYLRRFQTDFRGRGT